MVSRAATALVLVLCACGARTGLRDRQGSTPDAFVARPMDAGLDAPAADVGLDAPVDRTPDAFALDAFSPDAGNPCVIGDGPLVGAICERALDAQDATLSCPGGFVDVVARGLGTLRWECEGRRAEAVFAAGTYRGTRTGDAFALCIQTEFDFADGCRWQSSQRIEGDLPSGSLALTYTETPIVSDGACLPPCTAEARITVP